MNEQKSLTDLLAAHCAQLRERLQYFITVLPLPLCDDVFLAFKEPGKPFASQGDPRFSWSLITLLVAQGISPNIDPQLALDVAIAVEIFMCGVDLIDDIEDGDQTAIIQSIGTARVVNVASALLILAHKALLSLLDVAVDRSLILSLLNTLVNASLKSANGQHLDILFENREFADISGEESINMIGLKSGSLMSATMHLGALCAGAEKGICEKFAECGRLLGIAYQLDNDSHDLYNIAQSLDNAENAYCHKTIKTDLTLEKKTLPIIIANKYENILHVNEPDRKALKEGILVSWAVSLLYRERALECLQELEKRSLVSPLLLLVL